MTRGAFLLALAAAAKPDDTTDRFNQFAAAYNAAVAKVQHGEWPLRDLKLVQRRWRELQELPGWPKGKEC